MTEEKQHLTIAEAYGWTPTPTGRYTLDPAGLRGPYFNLSDLPDYVNDLNAIRKAEEALLDVVQGCIFCDHLFRIMNSTEGVSEFMKVHATAPRRAEALLKTLDLYEISKP